MSDPRGRDDGSAARAGGGRRRGPRRPSFGPPDILYHATSTSRIERTVARGALALRGSRPVFLSVSEEAAWRVAHRQQGEPFVMVVDVSRARRDGCRFYPARPGLWRVESVPARHILNLQPGYDEQVSAGGIPVWDTPDGPELALIRVVRRFGTTWEVAKGKLEVGETPAQASVREVGEEMGLPDAVAATLSIRSPLGSVRYGFTTPSGEPRLKTLHMFLLGIGERVEVFHPATREGIDAVGWFSPTEAARLVTHRSLKPLMRRVSRMLGDPGDEGGDDGDDEP